MSDITILVIDDEPSGIQFIIDVLQKSEFDCKVISSSNSKLGLEIAISAEPSIIITDWNMPVMDGIEVIKELKKNEKTREIPVIMASGVKMTAENLKLAMDCGAFDFMRKPINEVELIARINSAYRLVKYYKEKIENEKIILKIKEDNYQAEIELKKREMFSKTLMLIKINRSIEKFKENLISVQNEDCKVDCKIFSLSQHFYSEMIISTSKQITEELEKHFDQIQNNFYQNLFLKFPDLTKNERRLCAYLRLNLSTKDIASITTQSLRSIEMARTRLREKLGLKGTDEDLHFFLLKF